MGDTMDVSDEPELLTTETVVEYVKELLTNKPNLPLDLSAALVAREIGDGNLNYAWCVSEPGNESKAVFIKQAPGFIKCLGADFKLGAERLLVESDVLAEYTVAAPAFVPKMFARDATRCVMVTKFLHGFELMRSGLTSGRCEPRMAADVARFMALTHARTHSKAKPSQGWSHLTNDSMCGITAEFVFSKPLDPNDGTNRCSDGEVADAAANLRKDEKLCSEVERLKVIFLSQKECLVHGDLHTGSVMVPIDAATAVDAAGAVMTAKVIDAEFAHFGCAAFDLGAFIANLLFAHIASDDDPTRRMSLERMLKDVWATYTSEVQKAQPGIFASKAAMEELVDLTAGFCGCELIRRTIGAAHVDDIEKLEPAERKHKAEKTCLGVGTLLIKEGAKGLRGDRLLSKEFDAIVTLATALIKLK